MFLDAITACLKYIKTRQFFEAGSLVRDESDGAHPGVNAAPLTEPLVLPWPYEVHPAPVICMLKKEPIAVSHVTGEDVVHVKVIHKAGAVVQEVRHLTTRLDPFVETHVEQTEIVVLHEKQESSVKHLETDMALHLGLVNIKMGSIFITEMSSLTPLYMY